MIATLREARRTREWRDGCPPGRVERKSERRSRRHVQRAIKLASPGQVVRGRSVGTSVSHLHRNDQGIREGSCGWKVARVARPRYTASTDFCSHGIRSHTHRTRSTDDGASARLDERKGAKGVRDKDGGDGCDHHTVRSALRARRLLARPSDFGSFNGHTVEKTSSGSWMAPPETASPATRKRDGAPVASKLKLRLQLFVGKI